jgi:hypothetical protein
MQKNRQFKWRLDDHVGYGLWSLVTFQELLPRPFAFSPGWSNHFTIESGKNKSGKSPPKSNFEDKGIGVILGIGKFSMFWRQFNIIPFKKLQEGELKMVEISQEMANQKEHFQKEIAQLKVNVYPKLFSINCFLGSKPGRKKRIGQGNG